MKKQIKEIENDLKGNSKWLKKEISKEIIYTKRRKGKKNKKVYLKLFKNTTESKTKKKKLKKDNMPYKYSEIEKNQNNL